MKKGKHPKKENHPVAHDDWQARLLKQAQEDGLIKDPEKLIISRTQNLSGAVMDIAAPILESVETFDEQEHVLAAAVMVWNIALFPDEEEQHKELRLMASDLYNLPGEQELFQAMLEDLERMLRRKKRLHPGDHRAVLEFDIGYEGGEIKLRVLGEPLDESRGEAA